MSGELRALVARRTARERDGGTELPRVSGRVLPRSYPMFTWGACADQKIVVVSIVPSQMEGGNEKGVRSLDSTRKISHRVGDVVHREYQRHRTSVRTVFGEAWKWTHGGRYQPLPVAEALDAYDQRGIIPDWVTAYCNASNDERRKPQCITAPQPPTDVAYFRRPVRLSVPMGNGK